MVMRLRREVELSRRWHRLIPVTAVTILAVVATATRASWLAAVCEPVGEPHPQVDGPAPARSTIDRPIEDTPDYETPYTRRKLQQLREEERYLRRRVEQLKAKQFGIAHRPIHNNTECLTDPLRCL